MADEFDALLERVPAVGLRSQFKGHIEHLGRRHQSGHVDESHLPDRVRLPDHLIRRGSGVVRTEPSGLRSPTSKMQRSESVLGAMCAALQLGYTEWTRGPRW